MITAPTPPLPTPPQAPPNPPMFGGQDTTGAGARQRQISADNSGFSSTLGGVLGGNPTNTGQKTVLGQ